jgi:hypothetical protein
MKRLIHATAHPLEERRAVPDFGPRELAGGEDVASAAGNNSADA